MKKCVNFTILYQGLMFHLYHFHLALLPPRIVEVGNIPTFHDPFPPHIPLRIIGPKAPTLQPSPSVSPLEIKRGPVMSIRKKVKIEKGIEVDLIDYKEEVKGVRRKSRRLNKYNLKRKLRTTIPQEDKDSNFKLPPPHTKDETKGEDVEMEVGILDSSVLSLGDEDNGSKEVTHVSTSLTMNTMDLTLDQSLVTMDDRVTSPMTPSFLV